ncbi:MAG: ATP:cob(I)alamin adenosyltransferase [Candidatus Terrybacteria bacterium RIFCSPLOWO2_01_FULL_44_24]|uniref:Corrinoid adenosyltransferase n=1 Tax=Candidatus Terrybacteria bacterium RIFCSPHIGHO2_01_FULL_43_35 TaxID=1802361 RepID=A0A1G2PEJ6_9BACT|nr:MAG: ATP:cob(I)alamin adenosyltransferase [Candidatus Terrybacteria bacterium RIFCSPHIGHO2_01_FULL_43_35]OHA50253.1 MAG: ATP:cob(I)alamin adenosyltransferase [Candidatus Terrybacteria bacterium RIFCSPHIGHO2_02_FULL_43_14]OHA50996.1 MAG: ATP:cob(I)alamin adenosyltransferase [Candidatus Terrybacteria bacterium RIFCSPLOWO2_01_FULL_44_24]
MSRAFTGKGDTGETGIWGGERLSKSDPLINAVGIIDEANACLGLTASFAKDPQILEALAYLQNVLFTAGAEVSSLYSTTNKSQTISQDHIGKIEAFIELFDSDLPQLKAFILPSGSAAVTSMHLARTVVRRAERAVVGTKIKDAGLLIKFLNRVSSLLFVMARYLNQKEGSSEQYPSYGA